MQLHTIEEVATLLRKSVGTIYNYSNDKKFSHLVPPKASKKGEKVLFRNVCVFQSKAPLITVETHH